MTDKLIGKTQKVNSKMFNTSTYTYYDVPFRLLERCFTNPRCMRKANSAKLVAKTLPLDEPARRTIKDSSLTNETKLVS